MRFGCCVVCKPPKRNGYCHIDCVDYLIAKAFSDAERNEKFQRQAVVSGLTSQSIRAVDRANKRRKKR